MTKAAEAAEVSECREALLRGFRIYDRAVDVVAIFEYLFTKTADVSQQILHFDRFPKIGKGGITPDFAAITASGRGLIGEIARFANHDNSVDKLCEQLGRYDACTHLPGPNGETPVSGVDVVLFVDIDLGGAAVRRIIHERLLNTHHPYAASQPPMILIVSQDVQTQKYNFLRSSDAENGLLDDNAWPITSRLSTRFTSETLSIPPRYFVDIKAANPLMNDRPPPIYLAALLWSVVFPEFALADDPDADLVVVQHQLVAHLRTRYGSIRPTEVDEALKLLREAGLARRPGGGPSWKVRYRKLRIPRGDQLVSTLVNRICDARAKRPNERQLTLLDEATDPAVS